MKILKHLLILSVILLPLFANAQDEKDGDDEVITITGGLSYSTFGSFDVDSDWRKGFFVGVRKDVKLISALYLDFGLLYTQQGAIVQQDQMPDITFKSYYLDIPLGLKVKIGPFFAIGGITGNIKLDDNFSSVSPESDLDAFDIGYSLGLGLKVSIISLDVRWNNSFADTGELTLDATPLPIHNGYFLVGLGVSF